MLSSSFLVLITKVSVKGGGERGVGSGTEKEYKEDGDKLSSFSFSLLFLSPRDLFPKLLYSAVVSPFFALEDVELYLAIFEERESLYFMCIV